eukprot:SM000089S23826  [mRNA]  locus=s89:211797:212765:+ [translate_table: standard]
MHRVRPGLYLSGYAASSDGAALRSAGVSHVLSVAAVAVLLSPGRDIAPPPLSPPPPHSRRSLREAHPSASTTGGEDGTAAAAPAADVALADGASDAPATSLEALSLAGCPEDGGGVGGGGGGGGSSRRRASMAAATPGGGQHAGSPSGRGGPGGVAIPLRRQRSVGSPMSPQSSPGKAAGSPGSGRRRSSGGLADALERLSIPVFDDEAENLLEHLPRCLEFIERGLAQGAVLVHCQAGVSRR